MDDKTKIPILYRDEYIVIVNKPSGWLVHRSWLDKDEHNILMTKVRDTIQQHVYTVHRLDKATSGVILMALNPEIARILSQAFEKNEIQKKYHALVRGYILDSGEIDYPLTVVRDKIADKFSRENKLPQEAQTLYTPISLFEVPLKNELHPTSRYSLVELTPITGRKHQLRRHMSHLRHPIIGDTAHGDLKKNRQFSEFFKIDRLLLHASYLAFKHPVNSTNMIIQTPLECNVDLYEMLKLLLDYKIRN
ncbi:tRNA pseudouridine(65) synthase TruC [Thorsellia kenyensis]|uniref:tRNA pseudouridine synthase C n=1 Tax=Thorsellia kenyensis TaxID=1549888 RepID=A0ABV6C8V3_9GAMM